MNELDWSHLPGRRSIYPLSIFILTSPTILARPPTRALAVPQESPVVSSATPFSRSFQICGRKITFTALIPKGRRAQAASSHLTRDPGPSEKASLPGLGPSAHVTAGWRLRGN